MERDESKTEFHALMLANRLKKRLRHLKKWARRTGAGVFRLYDRDIPEIPLVLDYYGDAAMPQESALAGAFYKRPYEKNEDEEDHWLSTMKDAASQTLNIPREHIFLKQRSRQRGASQYEKMDQARFTKVVKEGGLSFIVNLSDYLDCGLFPDKRLLRAFVHDEAAGMRVLNLFSYTGSFSVYAAAGGAVSTDSVDLSNTYLAWSRENFQINGFAASLKGNPRSAHSLIREDALVYIDKAAAVGKQWDIIVLDPPAFSNSKKMTGSFDLCRDILKTVRSCIGLLASGGELIVSANARRFKMTARELEEAMPGVSAVNLGDKVTDEDFRGRKKQASFLIKVPR
jgi:23S rRNA G2069 N7-methylase RlmK/C1962 C5-methylase RlmI